MEGHYSAVLDEDEYATLIRRKVQSEGVEALDATRCLRAYVKARSGSLWRYFAGPAGHREMAVRILELLASYGDLNDAERARTTLSALKDDYAQWLLQAAAVEVKCRVEALQQWPSERLAIVIAKQTSGFRRVNRWFPVHYTRRIDVTPWDAPQNIRAGLDCGRARESVRVRMWRLMAGLLKRASAEGRERVVIAEGGRWAPEVRSLVLRDLGIAEDCAASAIAEFLLDEIVQGVSSERCGEVRKKWGRLGVEGNEKVILEAAKATWQ